MSKKYTVSDGKLVLNLREAEDNRGGGHRRSIRQRPRCSESPRAIPCQTAPQFLGRCL